MLGCWRASAAKSRTADYGSDQAKCAAQRATVVDDGRCMKRGILAPEMAATAAAISLLRFDQIVLPDVIVQTLLLQSIPAFENH